MIASRLGYKGRTTIPRAIRVALTLSAGDVLRYSLDGDRATFAKLQSPSSNDPFSVFREWDSEADRKAYSHL